MDHADSHYAAVVVAAKRARQINSYYRDLGEESFEEYPPPMVDIGDERTTSPYRSKSSPQGKIKYEYRR